MSPLTFSVIDKLEALVIFGPIRIKSNEHRIACGIDAERSQISAELSKRTVLDSWTIVDFNVVIADPHCKKSKVRKNFVILDPVVQRTIELIQGKPAFWLFPVSVLAFQFWFYLMSV